MMDHKKPEVVLDPLAGFCPGVKRAVETAGQLLSEPEGAACLGEMVHNEAELSRLRSLGLKVLDGPGDPGLTPGQRVLIRAHGEPPETYRLLSQRHVTVIDATCPVVTRLQAKVKQASEEMKEAGGTVVIFGKQGHPEVLGLLGNTGGNALVASGISDLKMVDLSRPLRVFAQTTSDQESYLQFCNELLERAALPVGEHKDVVIHQTVCRQVSRRKPGIEQFSRDHDVIVFVSGSGSSNGKYLADLCRAVNPETFVVTGPGQVRKEWFTGADSIGVSGATSAPQWLLEQIAGEISEMLNNR